MGLETATFISDLVSTNPLSGDMKSFGDNHIRLLKSTIKTTFPNVSGAVSVTHTELNKLANVGSTGATGFNVATQLLSDSSTLAASTAYVQGVSFAAVVPADPAQTLTDGATVSWNMTSGTVATLTIGGNRTMAAPTNLSRRTFILILIQDATGSRTLTWNTVFKWAGGVAPVLSTAAGAKDIFSFFSDGTNLYGSYLPGVA